MITLKGRLPRGPVTLDANSKLRRGRQTEDEDKQETSVKRDREITTKVKDTAMVKSRTAKTERAH